MLRNRFSEFSAKILAECADGKVQIRAMPNVMRSFRSTSKSRGLVLKALVRRDHFVLLQLGNRL